MKKRHLIAGVGVIAGLAAAAWAWQVPGGSGYNHLSWGTCNVETNLANCTTCCAHFLSPGTQTYADCLNTCPNSQPPGGGDE